MKENPNITTIELAEILEVSRRAVAKQIAKLKEEGKLKRIGLNKRGYYNVRTALVLRTPGFHLNSFTTLMASSVHPAPTLFSPTTGLPPPIYAKNDLTYWFIVGNSVFTEKRVAKAIVC